MVKSPASASYSIQRTTELKRIQSRTPAFVTRPSI